MASSERAVSQLARTTVKKLAEMGGRSRVDMLVAEVASTTGEMRTLVRHALRGAIVKNAIVRIRHGREASQDTLIEASAWKKITGKTPGLIARRTVWTERAILDAAKAEDWAALLKGMQEHLDRMPDDSLRTYDMSRWVPMGWDDDGLLASSPWQHTIPAKTVELRLRDMSEHDARGNLASQRRQDRDDEGIPIHRNRDVRPFDDFGAELERRIRRVVSLHRSGEGWTWFRPVIVSTSTPGAVALSAVTWSNARKSLTNFASDDPLPMERRQDDDD